MSKYEKCRELAEDNIPSGGVLVSIELGELAIKKIVNCMSVVYLIKGEEFLMKIPLRKNSEYLKELRDGNKIS